MSDNASDHRAQRIITIFAGCVIVAVGLWFVRGLLAPVLLALILVLCAYPARVKALKWGWSSGLANTLMLLTVVAVMLVAGGSIVYAAILFAQLLGSYTGQITAMVNDLGAWLNDQGVSPQMAQEFISGIDISAIIGSASDFIFGALGSAMGGITFLVIVISVLILLPVDTTNMPRVMNSLLPHRPYLVQSMSNWSWSVRRYMVITALLGAAQGALNGVVLAFMQIPGAFVWAVLSFVCSFIPNIGYFIALAPPLLFGAMTGGWPAVIGVIVLYGVINSLVQTVIQPRVVGQAVSLSPTLTFLSVLVWAVILGPLGAILAVPLTLFVRAVLIDADPNNALWRPITGDFSQLEPLPKKQKKRAAKKQAEEQEHQASHRAEPEDQTPAAPSPADG
ncbi:AI-2E family transporter [Glutamicibacter sp.]|uniref:AI-2E family transporter n=1 Tax=Glutamicibacter sp. TaxID=1931995 RepID=UPI0028BD98D2|nr:AI-2E family transporter [Glutamicibacter sp.]